MEPSLVGALGRGSFWIIGVGVGGEERCAWTSLGVCFLYWHILLCPLSGPPGRKKNKFKGLSMFSRNLGWKFHRSRSSNLLYFLQFSFFFRSLVWMDLSWLWSFSAWKIWNVLIYFYFCFSSPFVVAWLSSRVSASRCGAGGGSAHTRATSTRRLGPGSPRAHLERHLKAVGAGKRLPVKHKSSNMGNHMAIAIY